MASSESSLTMEDEIGIPVRSELDAEGADQNFDCVTSRHNGDSGGPSGNDARKDDRYWERRRKNNEAAKRSREKRRMNDIVMEQRIVEISTENNRLRTEIERLRRLYNIPEADILIALGTASTSRSSSSSAGRSSAFASDARRNGVARNATNGNAPNGGSRKRADVHSYSDASSLASSNENETFADRTPRGRATHAPHKASPAIPADHKIPLEVGVSTSASADERHLTTDNGAARVLPDLVTMGVLNLPLVQAILKAGGQPPANTLLQQVATLQQLANLTGSFLSNPTPLRHSSALDLTRQSTAVEREYNEHEENGHLVEENHTLRVELDQINSQVRELKEMVLQRDPMGASGPGAKRHAHVAPARAAADSDDSEDEDLAYSKRSKLAIVDDVNCN